MSQHFLHYTITSTLKKSANSTTHLAVHDNQPRHIVVLKIFHQLTASDDAEQQMLVQEMEKASQLHHPHIVPILEAGIEEGQRYIVSAYMSSGSLRLRLDRTYPQRLPAQQALTIISQIGQALTYLHARYLTHGQITPEHILFDADGHALLAGFTGTMQPPTRNADNQKLNTTFRYLAPEQFDGDQNELSDQYALCCVAYELLTGQPPFTLRDPQALAEQQRYAEPTPLRQIVPQVSLLLEQVILKGLAKDPAHRHSDIVTFLTALQQARVASTGPQLPLPRSKRKTAFPASSVSMPQPAPAEREQKPSLSPGEPAETSKPPLPSTPQIETDAPSAQPEASPAQHSPTATNLGIGAIFAPLFSQDEVVLPPVTARQDDVTASAPDDSIPEELHILEFDEILRQAELEREQSTPDMQDAPTKSMVQSDQEDSATSFEALMASLAQPAPQTIVDLPTTVLAPTKTQQPDVIPAYFQQPTKPRLKIPASSREDRSKKASAPKRSTATVVWTLILLLMIGSLWTYSALAAKEQTSSTLALLSNLPTPTAGATIDALGILAPATTSSTTSPATKTPSASKPTPKATALPRPRPTPTTIVTPIIPVLVPTATPKSVATSQPTPTPTPSVPLGKTIWLKSVANGQYVQDSVCSTNSPMLADATQVTEAEEFTVISNSDGTIDFQAVTTGKYVSAKGDMTNTPLLSCVSALQGWEKFTWTNLGNGKITLKGPNGNYVDATLSAAQAPLYATAKSISAETTFTWGIVK